MPCRKRKNGVKVTKFHGTMGTDPGRATAPRTQFAPPRSFLAKVLGGRLHKRDERAW